MKAFDKPSVDLWLRLAYDNLFERRPWRMKDRNKYHQTGNCYSYQWDKGITDKNRIEKKV